jgi:pimeloyl-ACP methyl ester carboxylesterase
MWLDGPTSPEGRVKGRPRELFLDMNGRALRANDPGTLAELPPAWPRLGEIDVPALLMVGQLDTRNLQLTSEEAAALIPEARFRPLDGVAHLPHLEGDPTSLEQITDFVNLLP